MACIQIIHAGQIVGSTDMANSNNWGEIYKSTWWGDKAWSANTLFIDSAPPGFGLNLLKASEDLDNTIDWDRLPDTTDVPTVSANTITDPNGGTTAERVDFTANRQARLQQRVTLEASKEYTFSIYAKVNTGTQNFRLRNVTLGDAESKTATTSWTRFSYTFTTTTAGDYDLSLQNNDNTARTLEFWGAMLNEGATAGDYVKTDASVGGSAPAPAYSGFGDAFGGVTAYYSLRQFTEAETLNAIRVRRSSDDTEQDIGFDGEGNLDTTALLAFVGTGGTDNGFVSKWYDQAGSNDAINADASEQPLVVSGGSIIYEGATTSRPAIQFDGVDDKLGFASNLNIGGSPSIIGVLNTAAGDIVWRGGGSDYWYFQASQILRYRNGDFDATWINSDGLPIVTGSQKLVATYKNSTSVELAVDGTSIATKSSGTGTDGFFNNIGSDLLNMDGVWQEIIIFNSDQSSNRTGIETNINDHFSIFEP